MKLSIVIATSNREILLKRCMSSLSDLPAQCEVVVIHNNYGLAKARNRGWQQAKGKYVAFIDDDAVATPTWLSSILRFIRRHPTVSAFGGPYSALNQREIPTWIPAEVISKHLPITTARPLQQPAEWLNGTNMIFRKDVLQALGGFAEDLGVKSKQRGYGEETDLQIRLANAGYEIWYDPSIKVRHEFMAFKHTLSFVLYDQYLHGKGSVHTFRHLRHSNPARTAALTFERILAPNLAFTTRLYYLLSPIYYLAGVIRAQMG